MEYCTFYDIGFSKSACKRSSFMLQSAYLHADSSCIHMHHVTASIDDNPDGPGETFFLHRRQISRFCQKSKLQVL